LLVARNMLLEATCCAQQETCWAQLVACFPQHVARPRNLLPRNLLHWCKRGLTLIKVIFIFRSVRLFQKTTLHTLHVAIRDD